MFFSMRLCITITKLLNRTLNYLLEYLCINYVLVVFASYGYFHFLLFPPEMIKFTLVMFIHLVILQGIVRWHYAVMMSLKDL